MFQSKVILIESVEPLHDDLYRGAFYTERYRRVACGHMIHQPGKDKAGRPRRRRHCRNNATHMRWLGYWADPRCTAHADDYEPKEPW